MIRQSRRLGLVFAFLWISSGLSFASSDVAKISPPAIAGEGQAETQPAKTKVDESKSGRKKFLETSIGGWKVAPGLAFKFGKGYDFSVGPKLNIRRELDSQKSLLFSASHLPVSFRDVDGGLKLTSYSLKFRNRIRPRFYYELGIGLNSFDPDSKTKAYVASQGGKIASENIVNESISLAYQVFNVKYSYRGNKRKLPFYFMVTWRETDDYEFGAEMGRAGDEFRGSRKGFSFRFYPMFRRF
ncbi:MAG: hypothetical protein GQF41_0720 [Candidatus Rifleibacterium amylolyticum]|nr:MAG: hypothetical protein GQF41_0720 [Candidatus Rifleibacterium amylolyticum]